MEVISLGGHRAPRTPHSYPLAAVGGADPLIAVEVGVHWTPYFPCIPPSTAMQCFHLSSRIDSLAPVVISFLPFPSSAHSLPVGARDSPLPWVESITLAFPS
jgi:hypothetical protein